MASMAPMPLSVLLREVGVVEKSMQSIDRGRKVYNRKKRGFVNRMGWKRRERLWGRQKQQMATTELFQSGKKKMG